VYGEDCFAGLQFRQAFIGRNFAQIERDPGEHANA
jgi:hypothetical protein